MGNLLPNSLLFTHPADVESNYHSFIVFLLIWWIQYSLLFTFVHQILRNISVLTYLHLSPTCSTIYFCQSTVGLSNHFCCKSCLLWDTMRVVKMNHNVLENWWMNCQPQLYIIVKCGKCVCVCGIQYVMKPQLLKLTSTCKLKWTKSVIIYIYSFNCYCLFGVEHNLLVHTWFEMHL